MKRFGILPLLFLITAGCGDKDDGTDPTGTETTDTETTDTETTDTETTDTETTDTETTDTETTDTETTDTHTTVTTPTGDTAITTTTTTTITDSADSAGDSSSTVTTTDTGDPNWNPPTGDTGLYCSDDINEPNDSLEEALDINLAVDTVVTQLSSDFWTVTVLSGDALTVEVPFDDYDVDIYAYDDNGIQVASGASSVDNPESMVISNATTEDVVYTVEVYLWSGDCTNYSLDLTTDYGVVPICYDDDIGNTLETATPASPGVITGTATNVANDFYVFTVESGDELSVGTTNGNIVRMTDADGIGIEDPDNTYQNINEEPVEVYVEVVADDSCDSYELHADVAYGVVPVCYDDDVGATLEEATAIGVGTTSGVAKDGVDDYYMITIASGDTLEIASTTGIYVDLIDADGYSIDAGGDTFGNYFTESVDVYIRVSASYGQQCPSYDLNLTVSYGTTTICYDDAIGNTTETATDAVVGVNSGLVIDEVDDYYVYTVQSGDELVLTSSKTIYATFYDEFGEVLTYADEYANHTQYPVDVYIRVEADYGIVCTGYDFNLDVNYGVASICYDDIYETNNNAVNPAPITPGTYSLVIADLDEDWFSISIDDGQTIDVSLGWASANDSLDLYLYDEGDTTVYLVNSYTLANPEEITYTNNTGAVQNLLIRNSEYTPLNDCEDYEMIIDVY